MKRYKIKWFIIVGILCMFLIIVFQSFFFMKKYVERITRLDLPDSAKIIGYEMDFSFEAIEPRYVKMEIDEETYNSCDISVLHDVNHVTAFQSHIIERLKDYNALNLNNAEEFKCGERMGSKVIHLIAATTRETYYIMTKEHTGEYFLYVCSP